MLVDEPCKISRVRATSEEEDKPEKVVEQVKEEKEVVKEEMKEVTNVLFDQVPDLSHIQVEGEDEIVEAYAGDQGNDLGGH